ncbi:energy-coupling factor ABC transporter ATP-binding protein [Sutterella sp.]|uniref:energy-coupling factor ABC transporter ATP-binding protein n=1 Tax=Sutterella sp. TaxID=1981025 RepID=UPI0026E0D711|nr:ABC transporter ATP-binding protein [Sutterella sp.]MDO5530517.1 ABC transporter ATP-binding protein [Sutterella sp.]
MSVTDEDFFRVTGLTFAWLAGAPLFRDADFRCGMTERLGIAADNGTGKSTFLRILTGLETPQTGEILCMGDAAKTKEDFRRVRTRAGFVLQNPDDQLFFPEVIDDVMFGPMNLGLTENEARERAQEVLARLGIAHLAHADSFSLSGGQKRLVTVASVLSMNPTGLLLDEPSTGLDRAARTRLSEVLLAFPGPEIIVSHDEKFLAGLCTRVVTIEDGKFRTL